MYRVHFLFSREKRGIEKFDGEKFLKRKTDREKRGNDQSKYPYLTTFKTKGFFGRKYQANGNFFQKLVLKNAIKRQGRVILPTFIANQPTFKAFSLNLHYF